MPIEINIKHIHFLFYSILPKLFGPVKVHSVLKAFYFHLTGCPEKIEIPSERLIFGHKFLTKHELGLANYHIPPVVFPYSYNWLPIFMNT